MFTEPEIIRTSVLVNTQGEYFTRSGQPRGVVIHYTAGRFHQGGTSARQSLQAMSEKGLGCLVMDTDGKIYRAENQQLNQVAFHAGKSQWEDKTKISYYCVGIEVCCAGLLDQNGEAWFGEVIPKGQRREIKTRDGNIAPGTYHMFSTLQEAALINFCLWQVATNPDFDIDWIVGHDEIAPDRKTDPGGSLSMSMPDFRNLIRNLARASS